nr:M12 family metallo-peptidase [Lysobacter sp. CAU 1642]
MEAQGGEGWLVRLDHPGIEVAAADLGVQEVAGSRGRHGHKSQPLPPPAADAQRAKAGTVIDVLYLYSADYAARYPGTAVETRIQHLTTLANQILANSGIDLALRAVGFDATAYPDTEGGGDSGFALSRMADALAGSSNTHPAFANLRARRDQVGADLVSLFWPADIETRGSCGIARLFGAGANAGVHVVSDGFSSWSLCADDVLAHEVGHNLGAEHQNGANSPSAGFGTAHVVLRQFHTVMGSFGSGNPDRGRRLARFSNPQQLCGGRPCGAVGVSDNARRIRDNMGALAAYRPSSSAVATPEPLAAIDPDSDGDGTPDSADAFPFDARYRSDRDGDGVADEVDAFPDNAAEWADTDGDGLGNNADSDDDNDGVPDSVDAFPLLASESRDTDGDGVGDNADAFPADRREWRDLDGDGIGDNADRDRDGDGFTDVAGAGGAQDLLAISSGNDRLLRYGDDGLFSGIEFAERHVPQVFGRQAALAWNAGLKRLYSTNASELRRYRREDGSRIDTFIAGFRGGERPGFLSGFPAAMSLAADGTVFASDTGGVLQRHDAISGQARPGGEFGARLLASAPRASAVTADGQLWMLESNGSLTAVDVATGLRGRQLVPSLVGGAPALRDPVALLVDADDRRLLVADAAQQHVVRVDPERAGDTEVLIAAGAGGLQSPSGLARLADGSLVVSSRGNNALLRFSATGQPLGRFDTGPSGLLQAPRALLALPRVVDRFPDDPARALLPVAGGWANPARLGHGLDLQNADGQLAVIWYTFRSDGRPIWYLALGPLLGDRWEAELLQFRWQDGVATSSVVGNARLDFADERNALFSWTLPGSSGSEPMQPLDVGPSSRTQFPTAAWFDPTEPGWGLSVTRQGGVDYAIAFLYDRGGDPSWLAGAADAADPALFPMFRYDGPTRCPGCPGANEATLTPAGSLRFAAEDADSARFESALSVDVLDWQRDARAFSRLTDTPTTPDGDSLPR